MKLLSRKKKGRPALPSTEGALATWWCQATPGTTYARCQVPSRYLPGNCLYLEHASLQENEDGQAYLTGQCDGASIWQFPGNATRAILMAHMQELGLKVLVEVDDNYLKPPPPMSGFVSAWSTQLDRSEEDKVSHAAHRKIVRWADGIIVSTPTLAEHYSRETTAPIYVCPNSVNLADWPQWKDRPEGPVRVGYAGSDSHMYDLAIVDSALDWAYRDGAALVKLGAKTKPWRWEHTQFPWANSVLDYHEKLVGSMDIGLCPLRRGEWADCKSDIKAIEYLAAGILPVVQGDSPVYADWVGIVPSASTPKEWVKVVRELVALDEVGRNALVNDAYYWMLGNKDITQHIHKWREAISW